MASRTPTFIMTALVFFGARPCTAQSFYGPGGLFVHPSAYTAPAHTYALNATWGSQSEYGARDEYQPITFSSGLTDRLEAGALVLFHHGEDTHRHAHFGIFSKMQLLPERLSHPAFAIGGLYRHTDALETTAFAVASKGFTSGSRSLFTAHLGAKYGRQP